MKTRLHWQPQILLPGQAAVWYYQDQGETLGPEALALLQLAEQARYADFGAAGKQREYLIGRLLLRQVLAQYLSVGPEKLHWGINANGKPGFANREWQFNLSHSYGHYAVGLSREDPIGVDLEWTARRVRPEYVERVFTAYEQADLQPKQGAAYIRRFFEIWTLKEAFWKALDAGDKLAFWDFGFHFDPFYVSSPLGMDRDWSFDLFSPAREVQAAVAVAGVAEISYFAYQGSLNPA